MAENGVLSTEEQREVDLVMRCFRRATNATTMRQREKRYIDRYRAYLGILERIEDVWQSQLSPPYVFQIIETIYSMIAAEHPRDTVLPNGKKDMPGAMALNKILPIQRRNDNFDEKYAQWVKQALVLGVSPAKIGWESRQVKCKRRVYDPVSGQMSEQESMETTKDQPVFDPIDASDFFWDPSASRLDDSDFAIARWWVTYESLKADSDNYVNLSMLKDQPRGGGGRSPMKNEAIQRDKSKLVEVLEYWDRERLICVANGTVLIRSEPMPYWHLKLPFVIATPVPDLYSMEGISEVELIKDIQAAIWTFLNQRLDNTRLISNAIVMIRDTIDDPDKLVFEPGAIWPVSDPQEVQMWTPNQNIGQASLEAEAELKSDLLNLTAAIQYLGGSAPEAMQNNTATGISIMQNAAQARVLTKRQRVYDALKEKGRQEIALNQQYWRGPIDLRVPGTDTTAPYDFTTVHAQDILCDCEYDIEEATESMNRQQRRDEALALFNTLLPSLQIAQMMGVHFNMVPMYEKLLDSFDVKDIENWVQMSPAGTTMGPAGPNPAAGALGPGGGNGAPVSPPPGLASLLSPGMTSQLNGGQ
jgi:hypothetical protein